MAGSLLASAFVVFSPLLTMKKLPDAIVEEAADVAAEVVPDVD